MIRGYKTIIIWADSWQNQQNDLCAQRRSAWVSTQSDQSSQCTQWVAMDPVLLHVDSEDSIRLGGCPGWSESSLGTRVIMLVLSWGGSIMRREMSTLWFHDTTLCYINGQLNIFLSRKVCYTLKLINLHFKSVLTYLKLNLNRSSTVSGWFLRPFCSSRSLNVGPQNACNMSSKPLTHSESPPYSSTNILPR